MAEHKHGSMDISEQEKTFAGFINLTIKTCMVIIAIVIFLAVFNS